ncbi:hypothetical protein EVAR_67417_1 [Eumeta japonica]|uniref:Uncharacterized protein n=1 Tax=Eumeta variegata TaxID=151549 RepID=A0A4C2A9Q7_EUMVA|nr:hypothetical protein EVAR_67417_1 [Eumeta japonica]
MLKFLSRAVFISLSAFYPWLCPRGREMYFNSDPGIVFNLDLNAETTTCHGFDFNEAGANALYLVKEYPRLRQMVRGDHSHNLPPSGGYQLRAMPFRLANYVCSSRVVPFPSPLSLNGPLDKILFEWRPFGSTGNGFDACAII